MAQPIDAFWGEYRFLSNFARVPVVYEGHVYPSVENAYQAAKSALAADRQAFVDLPPGETKRRAQTLEVRPDWLLQREAVMLTLLRLKFHQSPFRELLLATGRRPLVEGNTWGDTYWGVCDGEGRNRLGELLMQVRSEIASESG